MDTTLIIMAAGIGSRFGGGIKQLAAVGQLVQRLGMLAALVLPWRSMFL